MQHTVNASLLVCLSEKGFSLDELVFRIKTVFERQAFGEILRTILLLVEETLKLKVMRKAEVPVACECGHSGFVLNGHQRDRRIRTSLGEVSFPALARVKCVRCDRSHTLLLRYLGIERHQTKTAELEGEAIAAAAETSYRRAAGLLGKQTGARMAHSTLHGWTLNTQADEIHLPEKAMGLRPATVFADGTAYKGVAREGKAEKGEVKAMIGIGASGEAFPLGAWTHGETWSQIGKQLKKRAIHFPQGTTLVADAEPGLSEGLAELMELHQRCQWHVVRDLYHAMWKDGGRIGEIRPVQEALKAVVAVELPQEDFQQVPEAQKDEIEERMEKADGHILELIRHLSSKGFIEAARYVERARHYLFSYVRRWLKYGILCPRASSVIERFFRELGRRVKKIAYNWKEEGVGKIARILLKKYTRPEEWETYWRDRMRLTGAVQIVFRIVRAV